MNKQQRKEPFLSVVALWGICGLGAILYNGSTITTIIGAVCIVVATRYYSCGSPPMLLSLFGYAKILKQDVERQIKTFINEKRGE